MLSPSRRAISPTVSARTRAAANSSASGMSSSRRQTSATAAAFSAVTAKRGCTASARSVKSRTASDPSTASSGRRPSASGGSGTLSAGTRQLTSPTQPSLADLVPPTVLVGNNLVFPLGELVDGPAPGTATFVMIDGALPPGVTLLSYGVIGGRPTQASSFNVTVAATDSVGFRATRSYAITVNP